MVCVLHNYVLPTKWTYVISALVALFKTRHELLAGDLGLSVEAAGPWVAHKQ